ncbi:MAG TPA: Na-translocating system protein MpsC family protein [Solirubrobacteraceae bacterium]|nr:Na-translocating system protein MpsC family protein [Solirubrobacteraceae bacterium]
MSSDGINAAVQDGVSSEQGGRGLATLSNEMVRIYKEQFGRGPTKVRSHYAGPDTLICLLEHTFTPSEKNLQAMGEHTRLRDMRMFFQYAVASDFISAVQSVTGRQVRSFISGLDTNSDVAAEIFVLESQEKRQPEGPQTERV